MEHDRLDSILGSYLVQGNDFFVPNLAKKPVQVKTTLKTTTFIIVFTAIFPAGCDSCGRQRADEEGAGEPEPGGREAYGAAGRH